MALDDVKAELVARDPIFHKPDTLVRRGQVCGDRPGG